MTTYAFTIKSAADFNTDMALIDVGGKDAGGSNNTYDFNITANFKLDRQLDAINLTGGTASGNVLNISGAGASGGIATLDGNNTYNGLFVYNGTVNVSDLMITNAVAKGGSSGGGGGGGGGAGLGGGLFVAGPNPIAAGSSTKTTGGNVTLTNVTFTGDSAVGGSSGTGGVGGGGGGLDGGKGGDHVGSSAGPGSGGGGGGVGLGAATSSGSGGGKGILLGAAAGGASEFGRGGADGGGGGSTGARGDGDGGGGGGGVGGSNGTASYGGVGGFGGGGGGNGLYNGGGGGFGGGGGSGDFTGGEGGFGGGAGESFSRDEPGGFGGGDSVGLFGGGGLGAGGDIFVQQGGQLTIGAGSSLAVGTVTGGVSIGGTVNGKPFSSPGAAFGNGIFIQGNQTVTFGGSGSIGTNIVVAGVIADESGSVVPAGVGRGTGAGALAIENAIVTLSGANTYSGGTTIAGGNLDLAQADVMSNGKVISGAAGTGAITFAGTSSNPSNLTLEKSAQPGNGGTFATTLTSFGAHDSLNLTGLTYTAGSTATYDSSSHLLTITSGGIIEKFTLNAPGATTFYTHLQGFGGFGLRVDTVCFCAGTSIRTARGDVAVEHLAVGDCVVTASGAHRPIRWLGHRTVDCRNHPDPSAGRPIRIAAHAFGADQPARDLFLSPGHPVLVGADADGDGGHLVPIMCLVNGTTIDRAEVDCVTYWHVELDQHDILLAENLPAESYLDWGDRTFFTEAADHKLANPDFIVPGLAGRCRPVAIDGPVVEAERRRLDAVFATRLAAAAAWPSVETALLAHF